jgi:hypothetical protein
MSSQQTAKRAAELLAQQNPLIRIPTKKENIDDSFSGYFFGLTTAELLVAQNLGDRYRFIFVNTVTGHTLELKLNELFAKAKGIYPQWSISF